MKRRTLKNLASLLVFVMLTGLFQFSGSMTTNASSNNVIPKSQMTATATSEHNPVTYGAANAIDNNMSTFWATSWVTAPTLPQSLTLSLGGTYPVNTVRFFCRQEWTGISGVITAYNVYVSTDNITYTLAKSDIGPNDKSERITTFPAVEAAYVRLEATAGNGNLASVNEISIEYANEEEPPEPTPTTTPEPTPTATPGPTPIPVGEYGTIPQRQMTVEVTSTYTGSNGYNAIDGNTSTLWHSASGVPQSITLDLGAVYPVSKIKYQPRTEYTGANGIITQYEIYLSTNGTDFTKVSEGTWSNSTNLRVVKITPTEAKYVRLVAINGAGNYASVAELNVDYGIDPTEPVKLTLTPDMVRDEMFVFRGGVGGGVGYATMLVDEQDKAGDTPSGNGCVTNWNPAYDTAYYPASAYLDLGRNYKITSVYLNDMNGQGEMSFYTGTPFNWSSTPFLTDPLVGYGSWNLHNVNIETRYLRIVKANGSGMNELVLYGYPVGDAPPPDPEPPAHTLPKAPVDLGIGANVLHVDPVDKIAALGHVREYHPWIWDEGGGNPDYPGYPNNQNKYNPAYWGDWNFDAFYQNVRNQDVSIYSCIMQSVPWISGDPNNYKDKPIYNGEDPTDPASYIEHADKMFQSAARYGSVAVDGALLKLAPDQQRLTGLNLVDYFEDWNEPDQTFNPGGRKGYFHPYELAAMTSADYDGHEGTLGNTVGVKNADPNAKLVMAGLMDHLNILEYLARMKEWFYYNRDDHQFAADVINFHYYCTDGNKGISPEAANMEEMLKEVVDWCHANVPNKEVWLSEFGWDTGIGYTPNYAPSLEAQGQWIIRAYLASFAAGIDRASMFMLCDAVAGGTGRFDSCGLVTGNTPKPSWYYVYTMKNVMKNMAFDAKMASGNPNVYVYRFKSLNTQNPKYTYAVWCPTSNGTIVSNYQLDIGTENTANLTTLQEGYTNGIHTELAAINGKVTVNVSERPIFVSVGQIAAGLEISGSDKIIMPYEGQTSESVYTVSFKDQNGAPMAAGPVTWEIFDEAGQLVPDSVMKMDDSGILTVFTSTLKGTYNLKAVSGENTDWFAEKTISLVRADSVVTAVVISGSEAPLIPVEGATEYTYQAEVRDQFNEVMLGETILWSVVNASSKPVGTIAVDAHGVLVINSSAEPGMYILKAVSAQNAGVLSTKILNIAKEEAPLPPATVKAGHINLLETTSVGMDALNLAFSQAQADSKGIKTIRVIIDAVSGVSNYMLMLPTEVLAGGSGKKRIEIICPTGTIVVSDNMFRYKKDMNNAQQVGLYIGKPDLSRFSSAKTRFIGGSPVIEVKIIYKGEEISWKNRNSPIKVTLDYVPAPEELKHPNRIKVWYVDSTGDLNFVTDGIYDPATGKVTFYVTDF